LNKRVRT